MVANLFISVFLRFFSLVQFLPEKMSLCQNKMFTVFFLCNFVSPLSDWYTILVPRNSTPPEIRRIHYVCMCYHGRIIIIFPLHTHNIPHVRAAQLWLNWCMYVLRYRGGISSLPRRSIEPRALSFSLSLSQLISSSASAAGKKGSFCY